MSDPVSLARTPSVEVGIITRNRREVLPKAIRSALEQEVGRLSVAVVDDGSTDGTSALSAEFPQVRWTRFEQNRGIWAARNHLFEHCRADYIISLDDDAWFLQRDEIARAVAHMEAHPEVAAVAFDIVSPDQPKTRGRAEPHPVQMFIGCGHVLRMSRVRELGGYAPAPGFYGGEEKDLCLRLLARGWSTVLLPGTHVWHDKTMVARDWSRLHRSGVCNDLVFALRRSPGWALPLTVGGKVLAHLLFALRRGYWGDTWAGFWFFLRNLRPAWAGRAPVSWAVFRRFRDLAQQA